MVKQTFLIFPESQSDLRQLRKVGFIYIFYGVRQKFKKSEGKTKFVRTVELENLVLSMVFVGFKQKLKKSDGKTNFSDISRI